MIVFTNYNSIIFISNIQENNFYFKKQNYQIHLFTVVPPFLDIAFYFILRLYDIFSYGVFFYETSTTKLSNEGVFSDHNNHYFSLPLTLRESRHKITVSSSTWLIVNLKLCSTSPN